MKTQNKKCSGGHDSWRVLPGFGISLDKFAQGIWHGRPVTYVQYIWIFHNKLRASCDRPQRIPPPFAETCSSSSSTPITQSPPSPLSKPPPSLRLGDFVFCVMHDERLSIDRPACPFLRHACCCWLRLIYRCCSFSRQVIS